MLIVIVTIRFFPRIHLLSVCIVVPGIHTIYMCCDLWQHTPYMTRSEREEEEEGIVLLDGVLLVAMVYHVIVEYIIYTWRLWVNYILSFTYRTWHEISYIVHV